MSIGTVTIDGESQMIEEAEEASVSIEFEEDAETVCEHCGEVIAEYPDGWEADRPRHRSNTYCESRWQQEADEDEQPDPDLDEDEERAERTRAAFTHEPAEGDNPGAWANGAGVIVQNGGNTIHVWISLGDPRGGFQMTAERRVIDGEERITLSVPHPESSLLHLPLNDLNSRGYYRVGN